MSNPTRHLAPGLRRTMGDAEIVALYAELGDSELVGIRAGCSGTTVLSLVRAAGQPVAKRGGATGRRVHPTLPDSQMVALYREGLNAREVAERAGCSPDVVYRVLEANGVARRKGGAARWGGRRRRRST